jgi:hypothetical protein
MMLTVIKKKLTHVKTDSFVSLMRESDTCCRRLHDSFAIPFCCFHLHTSESCILVFK